MGNILKIIALFCLIGWNSSVEEMKLKISKLGPKKIVTVSFPTDRGRWTDQIVNNFTAGVSGIRLDSFTFYNLSWTFQQPEDELLNSVMQVKPDLVFLPDDQLYKRFAKKISDKTGAFILFVSFQMRKDDLGDLPEHKQAGVFCDHPIAFLLSQTRKLTKVESIGVVGGPYGGLIFDRIKEKIGKEVRLDVFMTDSWNQYVEKIKEFEKKYDAIWPLATFGVLDQNRNFISNEQVDRFLRDLKRPTLGYGRVNNMQRTIEMNINPSLLGEHAASIAIEYFIGANPKLKEFLSYSLRISEKSVKNLNLKVNSDLIKFISTDSNS